MTPKTTASSKTPKRRVGTHVDVKEVLPTLEKAYLALLQMPFGSARIRNQSTFAEVRNLIATLRGKDPETIQHEFEDRAADLHAEITD